MIISATHGREQLGRAEAKYYHFACRTAEHRLPEEESHLWLAAKAGAVGVSQTSLNVQKSPPGLDPTYTWSQGSYEVPEGLVIKVFGSRTASRDVRRAATFLLCGEHQPLVRLRGLVGLTRQNQDVLLFEGRASVISAENAKDLSVRVDNPHLHEQCGRDGLFTVQQLAPGTRTRSVEVVKVTNSMGREVELEVRLPRRKIKL